MQDKMANYSINYYDWNSNEGILHILQAAIKNDCYDLIRNQLMAEMGADKIIYVEYVYSLALSRYTEMYC